MKPFAAPPERVSPTIVTKSSPLTEDATNRVLLCLSLLAPIPQDAVSADAAALLSLWTSSEICKKIDRRGGEYGGWKRLGEDGKSSNFHHRGAAATLVTVLRCYSATVPQCPSVSARRAELDKLGR
jgi:hypothetical protein